MGLPPTEPDGIRRGVIEQRDSDDLRPLLREGTDRNGQQPTGRGPQERAPVDYLLTLSARSSNSGKSARSPLCCFKD